jgi:UDP-galactopyranose mutase
MQKVDIVIVGAGISGATLAQRYATEKNKKVLIIEKRDHIAGNCYDYINEAGHMVSKYGAHLFHTNYEDVWEYVNRFSEWRMYEHRVLAKVDGQLVPIPVNITTVNKLFGLNIKNEEEMRQWLQENQVHNDNPKNGEEAVLARVGEVLYEKMFKQYTKKQWDKYPAELDASVLQRIPVRDNYDDRYFGDKYQALPSEGYTKLFEKMLDHPNIEVRLSTDFFTIRDAVKDAEKLFYTGPIDRFFDFKHSVEKDLQWRSIRFEWETLQQENYQEGAVVNYPQMEDGMHTRIIEYKKIYPVTDSSKPTAQQTTTICREYSTDEGEPYYPVPNPENDAIFQRYKDEADKLKDIYFVGRLANYKYFNMDQAFKNALDLFDQIEGENAAKTTNDPSR